MNTSEYVSRGQIAQIYNLNPKTTNAIVDRVQIQPTKTRGNIPLYALSDFDQAYAQYLRDKERADSLLTTEQAAEYSGLSHTTIRGRIEPEMIWYGGQRRYTKEAIDKFLAANMTIVRITRPEPKPHVRHCQRCDVVLEGKWVNNTTGQTGQVPKGRGDYCGWCVTELASWAKRKNRHEKSR